MAVLETIPSKLKKLKVVLDDHFDLRCKVHLARYLERFEQHVQLKELVVHFSSLKNVAIILDAIHQLGQLERLMISFTTQWDYDEMERFIDGLVKGCPELACLEVKSLNAPLTYSMNALKQLGHLRRFAFSIRGMHNDDGFWYAIQGISQRNCIRIYPTYAADMDAIRRLQEQRRSLNIILDHKFTRFQDPF